MPWAKGQSGNPGGAPKEKKFLNALERAIQQDDSQRLRDAAEKLLDCASKGEPWAIQQLADRLDGKPSQSVEMSVRRTAQEMEDAELIDHIRRGSARVAESPLREAGSSEVH